MRVVTVARLNQPVGFTFTPAGRIVTIPLNTERAKCCKKIKQLSVARLLGQRGVQRRAHPAAHLAVPAARACARVDSGLGPERQLLPVRAGAVAA